MRLECEKLNEEVDKSTLSSMFFVCLFFRLPVSDIPEPTPFDTFLIIVVFLNF